MNLRWSCVVLCALIGCGDDGTAPDDLAVMDLADLSVLMSPLGGPCNSDADCLEGTTPVCFAQTLFNDPVTLKTANGYCSGHCTSDADCGSKGVCQDHGLSGKWCFAKCQLATDCRSGGYACVQGSPPYCFPSANLTCDPTAGGGACVTTTGHSGGCIRAALGPGMTGTCYDLCTVGSSCPTAFTLAQQCLVRDQRGVRDATAGKNDTFLGSICTATSSTNATGQACLQDGMPSAFACVGGDQCYTAATFTGGDDKCHLLCSPGYSSDAGSVPPVSCPGSAVCTDVWGLFTSIRPAGLCL